MRHISRTFLLAVLVVAPFPASEPLETEVTVGVRLLEPFALESGEGFEGFSIEIWEEVASRIEVEFDYVVLNTVEDQIDAVGSGEVDLATTAISITREREQLVDFSVPFYQAGLEILIPDQLGGAPGAVLRALSSQRVATLFGILIGGTLLLGLVLWLVERKSNEDFDSGRTGIFDGVWWAMVTLTTVGYGDKVPRTTAGRLVSFVWMIFGIVFISVFTATLASAITLDEFQESVARVEDLSGRTVVTLEDTTSAEFLTSNDISFRPVDSVESAFDAIESGGADAFVFDSPILRYYEANEGAGIARTVGGLLDEEYYGIALPADSPLKEPIDLALLGMYEDGTHERIRDRWFGDS